MTVVAMTIAGSDPSGGAGLQADLKTFHQHGVYGSSIVTLLTVQNTRSVFSVQVMEPAFVTAQIEAVLSDIPPRAAKTGALGNAAVVEAIAAASENFDFPLVVDPVMVSKHGDSLLEPDAVDLMIKRLLPNALLVTPNLPEAAQLAEMDVCDMLTMEQAAERISRRGPRNVLVKGGHLDGDPVDLLWCDGRTFRLPSQRVQTRHTHGTGCVLSAAITARLAQGDDLVSAVTAAKHFVTAAIHSNPGLGGGCGPLNLHAKPDAPA